MILQKMLVLFSVGFLCGFVGTLTKHPGLGLLGSFAFGALMGILEGRRQK